ncbi:Hypothetical predicted protein, partial [Olea europaea subsp. europaea]
ENSPRNALSRTKRAMRAILGPVDSAAGRQRQLDRSRIRDSPALGGGKSEGRPRPDAAAIN